MSIIKRRIELVGSKGQTELVVLFDSGATFSCIPPEMAHKLGDAVSLPKPMKFETAEKGKKLEVKDFVYLLFRINGYELTDEFMIVPNLSEEAIIGAETLQKWRIKLDFEHDDIIVDPQIIKLRI